MKGRLVPIRKLIRIACLATMISAVPRAHAGQPLPESSMPPSVVFQDSIDFSAVCVAESEPTCGETRANIRSVVQEFRLLGLVVGHHGRRSKGKLRYRMTGDGFERAVRKGERVIWLARGAEEWEGVHVFQDTPENRALVYSRIASRVRYRAHPGLYVRVETTGPSFPLGQPIPVRVQLDNTYDSTITFWSNFSALQFDALAEDGGPVTCHKIRPRSFDRTQPLIVDRHRGPVETANLADLCEWLPKGEGQRSYTLLWRGKVRIGDRNAERVEVISDPVRLTVLDPSILAWGAAKDGATCGLAAEVSNVSVGDRMRFHVGLRSDSVTASHDLHFYRYAADDEDVYFTFRNTTTETVYRRVMDRYGGGPIYMPKAEDFVPLQAHSVLVSTVPIRLLHESGEQIPAGTYEVTAKYEPRHTQRHSFNQAWNLHGGPLASAPVTVQVQPAVPESIEIRTNSAIDLKTDQGQCFWIGSQENPAILRVSHRPGFGFHLKAITSVSIGAGAFERVGEGGSGGYWIYDKFENSTWAGSFPQGLGEACRALANGDTLKIRVDVTIYETADIYQWGWPSPARGDSRVIWQGRLEAQRP